MKYYFPITALPALPSMGHLPAVSPSELWTRFQLYPDIGILLAAVFEQANLSWKIPANDNEWQSYYIAVSRLGKKNHCTFLVQWANFELGLCAGIERIRIDRFPSLGPLVEKKNTASIPHETNAKDTVEKWAKIENTIDAHRLLHKARWDWVRDHSAWFSFSADEIAAYGVALLLGWQAAVWENRAPLQSLLVEFPMPNWRKALEHP